MLSKTSWLLAFSVVSFIFQLAGFVSPGWIYLSFEADGRRVIGHIGLWYMVYCVDEVCDSVALLDIDESVGIEVVAGDMVEYQVETTLALTACGVAAILFLLVRSSMDVAYEGVKLAIACIACGLSGILALIAAGKYTDGIIKLHHSILLVGNSPFKISYSLLLIGIGGCLIIITAILVVVCKACGWSLVSARVQSHKNQQQDPMYPQTGYTADPVDAYL